jgi:hypothetical protein
MTVHALGRAATMRVIEYGQDSYVYRLHSQNYETEKYGNKMTVMADIG